VIHFDKKKKKTGSIHNNWEHKASRGFHATLKKKQKQKQKKPESWTVNVVPSLLIFSVTTASNQLREKKNKNNEIN
jgi:hypothetical protein